MKTKKIAFMNQKGGVGKTTLLKAVANYLSIKGKRRVVGVDADIQQSLKTIYDEDISLFSEEKSFDVVAVNLAQVTEALEHLEANTDIEYYLIDLPGQINDDRLIALMQTINIYITPFSYDRETIDSTGTFAKVLKHYNPSAEIYFVPNRIKKAVTYKEREETDELLSQFGTVTSEISDIVSYQRLRLFEIDDRIEREISKMLRFLKL